MNKQRKVLITITYNEMGIIIDTKAEEVAQPNLQPTCNQLATDCISRQAALDCFHDWIDQCGDVHTADEMEEYRAIEELPSAQQEIIRCKDCRKHNVHSGYKDDCCPLYEWRGMSYGHEHDYQYCSFAERREE